RMNALENIEAVAPLERQVQNNYVRLQGRHASLGLMGVFGLPANHQVRLPINQVTDSQPDQRMVVNEENLSLVCLFGCAGIHGAGFLSIVESVADCARRFARAFPLRRGGTGPTGNTLRPAGQEEATGSFAACS